VRGLAALGIVALHVWMYTGANDPRHSVLLDAVVGELRIGVTAFFVLSAFLLVRPWLVAAQGLREAPRLGSFVFRRAARILPAYWLALLGAFAVLWRSGSGRAADFAQLPLFAVLGQYQADGTRKLLIPQAWSLAVELSFYALLPLAGWALVRMARRHGARTAGLGVAALLAVAGLTWCAMAEAWRWPVTITCSLPTYLPIFACGMAAAALPVPRHPAGRRALLLAGAALVVANGAWHSHGTALVGHVVGDVPAAAGFGLVVAALAAGPAGVLDRAPARWLGAVSYGLYLWHLPVLYALLAHGLLPGEPALAIVTVLGPSLALAALSWYGIERPILRLTQRRRRSAARTSRATRSPARTAPSMYPAQ
jgi:peptidoglycan/LPS O-acetylase OafA/YrhL